jgi:hypothetical protein
MSVRELLESLDQIRPGEPLNWLQIREGILREHERATSGADRDALLAIHTSVMDAVDRSMMDAVERGEVERDALAAFRKARRQDYCRLIAFEAQVGDQISPQKLDGITRREVEAGRMAPDDELRILGEAGGMIHLAPEDKGDVADEPNMAARLGQVLYWLGCGLACAILALGGVMAYGDNRLGVTFFIVSVVAAVLAWLVGRACRYVLAGS